MHTNLQRLILSATILLSLSAHGQEHLDKQQRRKYLDSVNAIGRLPIARWTLSFNPLGLAEAPCAIGFGVGYRLSNKVEIWSETSFLTNGTFKTQGPLTGIRQILEGRYFTDDHRNIFIGAELRFKSYQVRDTDAFVNPATHDTLNAFSNFSRHYFFGAAFQVGWRASLTANGRFQLELTAGLGVRKYVDVRQGIPSGYEFRNFNEPIDIKVNNIEYQVPTTYFPGSVRLLYLFGKHLLP
jgi:hypothetical protein